jgi:coproporphyrinogen III oxidase
MTVLVNRANPEDHPRQVRQHLRAFAARVCDELGKRETATGFCEGAHEGPDGTAHPRVLSDGDVLEKAAVLFTNSRGPRLPEAATARRPHLAGSRFEAVSLSIIVHPRNPYAPTAHLNLRAFFTHGDAMAAWWFGGGFDLTPFYPFVEDVLQWHRAARDACQPFGNDLYERFKQNCDEYFQLGHRREARGVGGIFFDDFDEGGFERAFAFVRNVGDAFLSAYLPILDRRRRSSYGERERQFQLYRRGRYVEFNLLYDRGTRYGLQSNRRIESVLASLPPVAGWAYDWQPTEGTPEAKLYEDFLRPRDWLRELA